MKFFLTFALFLLPVLVFAQPVYEPLVGLPGVPKDADFNTYINRLYALSISIAALLAVIKIVIAGVKWMMTDIVTSKGEAKKDIYGALMGLLVVLGAVLILYVINPDITDVDVSLTRLGVEDSAVGVPPPVLDMSQVTITTLGTSGVEAWSVSPGNSQSTLLSNQCHSDANYQQLVTNTGGIICVRLAAGDDYTVFSRRTDRQNVEDACTDGGGELISISNTPGWGVCITPK